MKNPDDVIPAAAGTFDSSHHVISIDDFEQVIQWYEQKIDDLYRQSYNENR